MTTMPMTSDERMQRNTATGAAERIAERTRGDVERTVRDGVTERRLGELDREWDVERLLFTISGLNVLLGALLAFKFGRRWLVHPAVVAAFQVQHGLQGWCPPFAVLRRFGVRTRREIDAERAALKAIRGDFSSTDSPERSLEVAST